MKTKVFLSAVLGGAIALLLIFGLSSFRQQDESPRYITLNSYEISGYTPLIVIMYENGETEKISLEKYHTEKALHANAMKVHETINMLSHKGYKLVSSSRNSGNGQYIFGQYIFEKR